MFYMSYDLLHVQYCPFNILEIYYPRLSFSRGWSELPCWPTRIYLLPLIFVDKSLSCLVCLVFSHSENREVLKEWGSHSESKEDTNFPQNI